VNQAGIVLDPEGIAIDTVTNEQRYSSLAFDGTNYLVIWEDFRSGFQWDIYGVRLNQTGVVLDSNSIVISAASVNSQYSPSIAFDGTNYLVVWFCSVINDIVGIRVNELGTVVDTISITITNAINGQYNPRIAFDGTNYLVVWDDYRNGEFSDIYGSRVNQSGLVLDPNGIVISPELNWQEFPSLCFGGSNYFVVWKDDRGDWPDIFGARVNRAGLVLDPNGIRISNGENDKGFASAAFDGTNYFVVWSEERFPNEWYIYGSRVSQTGIVLDPNGIPLVSASNSFWGPHVSIAFDGTNYLMIWEDYRGIDYDIYGTRLNQFGIVLDPNGIPISTAGSDQAFPSVVFEGSNFLVIWEDYRSGYDSDIYGAKLNTSGTVIDSFFVSVQPGNQYSPALVKGSGNQALITYSGWTDSINHHPANTMRIWGKFYPFVGMEDECSTLYAKGLMPEIYPNPFRNLTQIKYAIKKRGDVSIKIYDIAGKSVRNLIMDNQEIGIHIINWDGRDDMNHKLPAGVYFCSLRTSKGISETKEIIILR